jgi:RNA polymerase sigma-70 factor (ECF subfamily)
MSERTNEQWLADLQSEGTQRNRALEDLRARLERGLLFYLNHQQGYLGDRSAEEIEHMVQDFVQEALLRILNNLNSFRGESQFITWASKVAARVAISELRRARYKDYSLEHLTAEGEIMPALAATALSSEAASQPELQAEREEALRRLDEAISEILTERQRLALLAHVVDGVPVEEIARRMNTNRNALYKLVHDARLKLKRHMEKQGLSPEYMLALFGGG